VTCPENYVCWSIQSPVWVQVAAIALLAVFIIGIVVMVVVTEYQDRKDRSRWDR
jgi:hypothetical protein